MVLLCAGGLWVLDCHTATGRVLGAAAGAHVSLGVCVLCAPVCSWLGSRQSGLSCALWTHPLPFGFTAGQEANLCHLCPALGVTWFFLDPSTCVASHKDVAWSVKEGRAQCNTWTPLCSLVRLSCQVGYLGDHPPGLWVLGNGGHLPIPQPP